MKSLLNSFVLQSPWTECFTDACTTPQFSVHQTNVACLPDSYFTYRTVYLPQVSG